MPRSRQEKHWRYRWANPLEWLTEASQQWTPEQLRAEFLTLAGQTCFDDLQEQYQSDMDKDGYFDELPTQEEPCQTQRTT